MYLTQVPQPFITMLVLEARLLNIGYNFILANSGLVDGDDLANWETLSPELLMRQLPWPRQEELQALEVATPASGLEFRGSVTEQMSLLDVPMVKEETESDGEQGVIQRWLAMRYEDEESSNSEIYSPPASVITIGSDDWVPSDPSEDRWLTAEERAQRERDELDDDTLSWEFESRSDSDAGTEVSV